MEICFRCEGELQDDTPEQPEGIEFYSCTGCGSGYARKSGQQLHDRWSMPLSVVLYPVIFDKEPYLKAERVAKSILARQNPKIAKLKEHILAEIEAPKQKVSQIHDFAYPDEDALRKYLVAVYERLNAVENCR